MDMPTAVTFSCKRKYQMWLFHHDFVTSLMCSSVSTKSRFINRKWLKFIKGNNINNVHKNWFIYTSWDVRSEQVRQGWNIRALRMKFTGRELRHPGMCVIYTAAPRGIGEAVTGYWISFQTLGSLKMNSNETKILLPFKIPYKVICSNKYLRMDYSRRPL